jgi:hypothetical protein
LRLGTQGIAAEPNPSAADHALIAAIIPEGLFP